MKTAMTNLLLVTAAMIAGSTMVCAQTVTADIPFQFRAAGAAMAPGSYELSTLPGPYGGERFQLRNLSSNKPVFLIPGLRKDAPRIWTESGQPKLAFTCSDNGCALQRFWLATDNRTHDFQNPQNKEPRYELTEKLVAAVRVR